MSEIGAQVLRTTIAEAGQHEGRTVSIPGWLYNLRKSGKIVFPLLRPTMLSVFILEVFWIWNDYLLPVVLLNNNKLLTIPLAIKRMFGLYSNNWDLATSGLVMSIIPILIVYVFLQKRIISGIVSGAIKG